MHDTMLDNEFPVDINAEEGQGTLLVTSHLAFHDGSDNMGNLPWIMDLGDTGNPMQEWHIVTGINTAASFRRLDSAISTWVNGYCMGKVWVDAEMKFIGHDGEIIRCAEYGMSDGECTLTINVYVDEFFSDDRGPGFWDWAPLLQRLGVNAHDRVNFDDIEEIISDSQRSYSDRILVVRSTPENPNQLFRIRGFAA